MTDRLHRSYLEMIYGRGELTKHFGNTDPSIDEVHNYIDELVKTWDEAVLEVPYTNGNLRWVLSEVKKLGSFDISWKIINGTTIQIRAANITDLVYLKLMQKD